MIFSSGTAYMPEIRLAEGMTIVTKEGEMIWDTEQE